MIDLPRPPRALLLDIDGVLHVGDEPLPGAHEAMAELRALVDDRLRLVTNTTSKSRGAIVDQLRKMGFELDPVDVLTPAALAVAHCREAGHRRVALLVGDSLRADLAELPEAGEDESADAVVLGDLGSALNAELLNSAFRRLIDGAELIALQHNRYWRRADGLAMDVGAWSAALEYASGVEATVVGKPSPRFFAAALRDVGAEPGESVMVGDDVEGDVGGGLDAGIASVLVRTGKYSESAVAAAGVSPTATIDSIADLPRLLGG